MQCETVLYNHYYLCHVTKCTFQNYISLQQSVKLYFIIIIITIIQHYLFQTSAWFVVYQKKKKGGGGSSSFVNAYHCL